MTSASLAFSRAMDEGAPGACRGRVCECVCVCERERERERGWRGGGGGVRGEGVRASELSIY